MNSPRSRRSAFRKVGRLAARLRNSPGQAALRKPAERTQRYWKARLTSTTVPSRSNTATTSVRCGRALAVFSLAVGRTVNARVMAMTAGKCTRWK